MKKILFLTVLTALTGCVVSEDEFVSVQSDVSSLQQKMQRLENQLSQSNQELTQTKGELAVVKQQRVVRLPTGSPTETRSRNSNTPYQTGVTSSETKAMDKAIELYRSGDIKGAVEAFEAFVSNYPNSVQKEKAVFYLAQASYTARDYTKAQQALEPLVFQPINGKINLSSAKLLQSVYQAQGNAEDEKKLSDYLSAAKSGEQPQESSQKSAESNDKPLRPQSVN